MRTREEQIAQLKHFLNNLCPNLQPSSRQALAAVAKNYIEEAEQRVRAEIARDSERLDWLEKLPRTEAVFEDRLRVMFFTPIVGPWDSLRETIDAAREVG